MIPIRVPNTWFARSSAVCKFRGEYSPRNLQTADERADQVFAARIGLVEGKDQLRAGMSALIHVPK